MKYSDLLLEIPLVTLATISFNPLFPFFGAVSAYFTEDGVAILATIVTQ